MQNDAGDLVVGTVLANEEMACVARYLSRGRQLHSLDEATLKQLYVDEVRRRLRERTDKALWDDLCGEISLRGISFALPPELQAAVERVLLKPEVFECIGRRLVDTFYRISAEPKN